MEPFRLSREECAHIAKRKQPRPHASQVANHAEAFPGRFQSAIY